MGSMMSANEDTILSSGKSLFNALIASQLQQLSMIKSFAFMEVSHLNLMTFSKSTKYWDQLTYQTVACSVIFYGVILLIQKKMWLIGVRMIGVCHTHLERLLSRTSIKRITLIWFAEHIKFKKMAISFSPEENWSQFSLLPTTATLITWEL